MRLGEGTHQAAGRRETWSRTPTAGPQASHEGAEAPREEGERSQRTALERADTHRLKPTPRKPHATRHGPKFPTTRLAHKDAQQRDFRAHKVLGGDQDRGPNTEVADGASEGLDATKAGRAVDQGQFCPLPMQHRTHVWEEGNKGKKMQFPLNLFTAHSPH